MNNMHWSADRNAHLKILAVSLGASLLVIGVGINARVADRDTATARIIKEDVPVIVGKPKIYTDHTGSTIR